MLISIIAISPTHIQFNYIVTVQLHWILPVPLTNTPAAVGFELNLYVVTIIIELHIEVQ